MNEQRRSLILGAIAVPVLSLPAGPRAETTTPSLDEFIQISADVCQRPANTLNRDMAQRILSGLDAQGKASALADPQRQADAHPTLAAELRSIWFSGMMETPSGAVLVGFQHVLSWDSASFLHVPGSCGGATGYWSHAPAPLSA